MVLTIPSQRRYAGYFKNVLDGVKPSQPPLLLKRIIMSEAPRVSRLLLSWKKTLASTHNPQVRTGIAQRYT